LAETDEKFSIYTTVLDSLHGNSYNFTVRNSRNGAIYETNL
jgi:hypothetical protein